MELYGCSSCEQDSLISELTQGMELAQQLNAHTGAENAGGTKGMLAEQIHSKFERALLIVNSGGSMEQSHQHVVPSTMMPGSPLSVIGSPKSEDLNPPQDGRDFSRKRKMMPIWTDQVRVSSENAVDGPPDDSYSWRKYGQKDILGAKHPRSYYRCTYQKTQGCCAIKQVQRNDADPLLFDITYKGTHTCTLAQRSKSAPTSPAKQEYSKQHNLPIAQYHQQPDMLLNFQTGLSFDIQNLVKQEPGFPSSTKGFGFENHTLMPSTLADNNFHGRFAPSFMLSPTTSELNYFSTSPCNMSTIGGVHQGQHSKSDITETISANTSRTNSPIIGIDFPVDQLEFNPCFPFDNQAFFHSFSQGKEQSHHQKQNSPE